MSTKNLKSFVDFKQLICSSLSVLSFYEIILYYFGVVSYIVSWLSEVEDNPKIPFSFATTPRGGHYSILWIVPLTFDPCLIMLSVKQEDINYHFLSFWFDSTWDWTPVSQYADATMYKPLNIQIM